MFLTSVLRSFLTSEDPPNKVLAVQADAFTSRSIHYREDGLVLYSPKSISGNKKEKLLFEIVLHRPILESNNTHSLFRTEDQAEAEIRFLSLKDKLPDFIDVAKDMCNVHGLQKICDLLAEHPQYTLAHMAAHFALYDAFSNPKISSFLNSTDEESGMSPLQVAISTKNLRTVQILVEANCSLEHLDHKANSVLHYAASTSKEIISVLTQATALRCLSSRNKDGYTPLHQACLADKPDCVRALLLAGADVNKTATNGEDDIQPSYVGDFLQKSSDKLCQEDMKAGGTPLHWACSKIVIETLINMNCYVDLGNFQKRTALHIMVLRNRLDCAVALLSRGANPDLGDDEGNRPIHLAVQLGHIPIIQALIVFGADMNVLNNAGGSPRHMVTQQQEPKLLYYLAAVGAKRCSEGTVSCTEGCKCNGSYEGIPPPPVQSPTNRDQIIQMLSTAAMDIATEKHKNKGICTKGRLLSLDGGGIRGLVIIQCLLELENVFGKPIAHCFDWFAGTSTGGILALAIASGKTLQECLRLYFRLKEETFMGNRPYSSQHLEQVLKETFGTHSVMADIKCPRIMITGVLADRKPAELHLFRNYESSNEILGIPYDSPFEPPEPPERQLIWEVGRATGAAPTYFRAFGRYLDGGLIANNPTLDALTEIHEHCLALKAKGRYDEASPVSVVVSIGTGVIPVTEVKSIDMYRPEKFLDSARLMLGMSQLGNLLIDQATCSDGRVIDRARAWCSSIGVPYFRFSPQMSEDYGMDEKSDDKLCHLLWETKVYMRSNFKTMLELADIVNN